jgi:hypothetical protein
MFGLERFCWVGIDLAMVGKVWKGLKMFGEFWIGVVKFVKVLKDWERL